jgi:hypothetical protein
LSVDQCSFRPDPLVAAFAALASKLNELLGIRRGVEQWAELLHPDGADTNFMHPVIDTQFDVVVVTFWGRSSGFTVFLASAKATSGAMPNTANVLMGFLRVAVSLAG